MSCSLKQTIKIRFCLFVVVVVFFFVLECEKIKSGAVTAILWPQAMFIILIRMAEQNNGKAWIPKVLLNCLTRQLRKLQTEYMNKYSYCLSHFCWVFIYIQLKTSQLMQSSWMSYRKIQDHLVHKWISHK